MTAPDQPAAITVSGDKATAPDQPPASPAATGSNRQDLRDRLADAFDAEPHFSPLECACIALRVVRPELDSKDAEIADLEGALTDAGVQLITQRQRAETAEAVANNIGAKAGLLRLDLATAIKRAEDAEAEVARLHAGESDQPGGDVHQVWTPAEWLHWFLRAPADERIATVERIYAASRHMVDCILDRHEKRIADLTERAEDAEREVARLQMVATEQGRALRQYHAPAETHQQIGDLP